MSSNFVSAQPSPALATKLQFDNIHETEEKIEDEDKSIQDDDNWKYELSSEKISTCST